MFRNFLLFLSLTGCAFSQSGNPAITTGQYNTSRTAANLSETILAASNVNTNQFGKLFLWQVDGWIFAQPLYVPGVQIGGTTANVVYVATMHNSVYAFDADNPAAPPLWQVNFGSSVQAPSGNGCPNPSFTGPELGILSTPAIDQPSGTLYVVSASPSGGGFLHYIHALDITSGAEKLGGPMQIQASVSGKGYDSNNGTVALSTASTDVQRAALLLANGSVYAAFGNCGPDIDPWHGWIVGYSATNLRNQTLVFNSTPNGGQGGIWQSGRGLVTDSSGNLYFATGNSTRFTSFDANVTTGSSTKDAALGDYAMRLLQLSSTGSLMASYPPQNYTDLNTYDLDFSSSGPLLIPGTNLLLAGGKDGIVYLFNLSNLAAPLQNFQATGTTGCTYSEDGCQQIHDLAFWNNALYVWGSNDVLRAYQFANNKFTTTPSSQNTITTGYHPASIAISANSTNQASGVLWALTPDSIFHAFRASNVANELWNSTMNAARDGLPSSPRFTEPTVANGRVYVATQSNQVAAYGLLSDFTVLPSSSSQNISRGSSASFNVNVSALAGSTATVTFSIAGLPGSANATFDPSSVNGSGSSKVTINTASSTPVGAYNLTITGTGNGVTRNGNVVLNVTNTCSFLIDHSSDSFTDAGGSGSIGVSATGGCPWTASSNAAWISISSGSSGSGSGAVVYNVSANTGAQSRTGTLTVAGQTFTVTEGGAPPPPTALRFIPIAPCRIADTRNANGPFGGPELSGGSSRTFSVPNSACGIPSTAAAYSLNVTVVPPGQLNYLTIWPAGQPQPTVSTLNSDGRIKANAAIVPAGSGGAVSVYVTDSTQFILDIDGYFVSSTNNSALAFYPLNPCRVVDTRQNSAPFGAPPLAAGETRSFPMFQSSCNIPTTAQAYSLNVTAIPQTTLSYLTSWPAGQSRPTVSTLNASTGAITANAAIVPAGTNGDISIYVSDASNLVIDINGYFAPSSAGGLSLYALQPCRVLDTRSSSGQFNGTLAVTVAGGNCGAPAASQAVVVNATVVPPGQLWYLTLWPDGQQQPVVSTLNALDGAITSNMATVPTRNGAIDAFGSNPTQLIIDISGYFAP